MFSEAVGLLTVFISLVGVGVALSHALFYSRDNSVLAKRLRYVFTTDAGVYAITLVFGLWAYFGASSEMAYLFHWIRVPLLVANIVASVLLYRHYRLSQNGS